ncbi:MAG TPA: tRNA threonylcarbamoyladenosine dehydratase [Opitutaceae bacterium]|nr:tRNA threonylcarbamoyladenosine dehydratase [Opitutaceae bacterium]
MTSEYLDRFGGLTRLYGAQALERLQAAHVCVIGVGGVGSWTVEALARSGIGTLTMIDLDDVCITNTNRQLPALEGQVGRPKVTVLAERACLINPECRVETITEFFTEATAERLLTPRYNYVVDAIDRMSNKALIVANCVKRGLPLVTVGGAGGKRDATQVRTADLGDAMSDKLLRLVRKKLRRDHGFERGKKTHFGVRCVFSTEPPLYPWRNGTCSTEPEPGMDVTLDCESGFGTAAFVTGAFGLAAAGEVISAIALKG